jgi:hypothetical protein
MREAAAGATEDSHSSMDASSPPQSQSAAPVAKGNNDASGLDDFQRQLAMMRR